MLLQCSGDSWPLKMALELIIGNAFQKLVLQKVGGLVFSFVPPTVSPVTKCREGNSSLTEQPLQTRLTPSSIMSLTFGSDNLRKGFVADFGLEDLFEHKSVINRLSPGAVLAVTVCSQQVLGSGVCPPSRRGSPGARHRCSLAGNRKCD